MYVDDAGWGALDVLEWCKYASGIQSAVYVQYTRILLLSSMSTWT